MDFLRTLCRLSVDFLSTFCGLSEIKKKNTANIGNSAFMVNTDNISNTTIKF